MRFIDLILLIGVIFLSVIIGTGIRLYIMQTRNIIFFSIMLPLMLIRFTVHFIINDICKMTHTNGLHKIIMSFKVILFIISELPMLLSIGCSVVQDTQLKYKKKTREQYNSYKTSYRNKVQNVCKYV